MPRIRKVGKSDRLIPYIRNTKAKPAKRIPKSAVDPVWLAAHPEIDLPRYFANDNKDKRELEGALPAVPVASPSNSGRKSPQADQDNEADDEREEGCHSGARNIVDDDALSYLTKD